MRNIRLEEDFPTMSEQQQQQQEQQQQQQQQQQQPEIQQQQDQEEKQCQVYNQNNSSSSISIGTTFSLCFCMLTHSYLLISVFPYSAFMAIDLLKHENNDNDNNNDIVNEDSAGQYAGMIAASFMFGRACTAIGWGKVADRWGRVPVLYVSLLLSFVLSLGFGIVTRSYAMALAIRFLLGCSNGILGTVKTIVSELNHHDSPPQPGNNNYNNNNNTKEKSEVKVMSLVMGMWGWGFLISPAISGILAEPVKQYYNSEGDNNKMWLEPDTWTGQLLRTYPFLLPNLFGALWCLVGTVLVYLYIPETLPANDSSSTTQQQGAFQWLSQLWGRFVYLPKPKYQRVQQLKSKMSDREWTESSDESSSSFAINEESKEWMDNDEEAGGGESNLQSASPGTSLTQIVLVLPPKPKTTMISLMSNSSTRKCLLIYWFYSFVNITVDEILPLFLLSKTAGFGITEIKIGTLLSACGLLFAIGQYGVCSFILDRYGTYGSIRFGSIMTIPFVCLIPASLWINHIFFHPNTGDINDADTMYGLHWTTFWFLANVMALYRLIALVFFTGIAVACNHTVSADDRATMNGLSVLGGSIAKGIGPAFAGFLATKSVSWFHQYASILMFGVIASCGLAVSASIFLFLTEADANQDAKSSQEMSMEDKMVTGSDNQNSINAMETVETQRR